MKEVYFTHESIRSKSRELLGNVLELRHRRSLLADQCALLVLDMQKYFLNETSHAFIPSAVAIMEGVNDLIASFSEKGLPVILTQHVNTPENAGAMTTWWRDLITDEHPLSPLSEDLDRDCALLLKKCQYDAFHETRLADILREKKIRQIVICGVMTHLCCESTARSAFMRGFDVFFAIDGTATYKEAFHRATLLNLSHGFAVPLLVEEILAELSGSWR